MASGLAPARVAVVGTGSLGKEHARIYAGLAKEGIVEFAGVYDVNGESAAEVGRRYGVSVFGSEEALTARVDAVSLVTPTHTHYRLARRFLELGKHVLVEKPMTDHAGEAAELVRVARAQSRLLMVGHVERFNPVFQYLQSVATEPRFIETHRLSPYPARSTDIGVVLDLMIHDLDIAMAFVRSPVVSFDAVGIAVLSGSEDIANARLRFANGCVANLTASRISPERMRKIRVFSGGTVPTYVSLDYRAQTGFIYRLARDGETESSLLAKLWRGRDSTIVSEFAGKRIVREPVPLQKEEPLQLELRHFVNSVQAMQAPLVSGESAMAALEVAFQITQRIAEQQQAGEQHGPALCDP
jgi:predicted dehydrogenase